MRTLYLECAMGAAGDMLAAALLSLFKNREEMLEKLNGLGIPGVEYRLEEAEKCGIKGQHLSVKINGEEEESRDAEASAHEHHHHHHHHHGHEHHHGHVHRGLTEIEEILSTLSISEKVRKDAKAVYTLIAEAEGEVHGKKMTEIHFHELGSMDAIADIVAVCVLLEELAVDRIAASPVHMGSGSVHCAHGILPVPTPATALLLRGIPSYSTEIKGELCTPTGAALLRYFAGSYGNMPLLKTERIGYGMGKKDFERANVLRAFLGEEEGQKEQVLELSCNLDDMTAEDLSFAMERLWEAGALDVYTESIGMKKNRPAVLLSCLCRIEERDRMVQCLFRHTSTIGIREKQCSRYVLKRREERLGTDWGEIGIKFVEGYGVSSYKYEYEDLARIARERGCSLSEVRRHIELQGNHLG